MTELSSDITSVAPDTPGVLRERVELLVFVRDYVQMRRQTAASRKENWPGRRTVPFMTELCRRVDAAFPKGY